MQSTAPQPLEQTLSGKVAIVSGSSAGIGAAIARELSRRGAHVVINYPFPSEEPAAKAVQESLKGTGRSITVEADLSTLEGPQKLAEAAAAAFDGTIDILINNAGRSALCSITSASDAELAQTWDAVVNLNGRGTLLLTRAVLPFLARAGSRVVNVGSSTSRDPDPDMSVYAGSKGMVESFTRCWARELPRRHGCTVNTVAPGPVATAALLSAPPAFTDALREKAERVPVAARFAEPEEIAWTVAMLCEEKAGWLNGLYIPVSGGYNLL
ncbi:putative short chain protein [Neofusicoccum parvum]|nr:putative short chain protein [Neofusicoccum parvum]